MLGVDDALRLQHAHRLAQRRAAYTQALRQLHLRDAGAVRDRAVEDQPAQVFVQRACGGGAAVAAVRFDGVQRDAGPPPFLHLRHRERQCMQLTTMRRIDVHCHPNTVEWFSAINPYVEALRTYWHRPWAPLSEQQVIDELRAADVQVLMVACATAIPTSCSTRGRRWIHGRAKRRSMRRSTPSRIWASSAFTSIPSAGISPSTILACGRCSRRSTSSVSPCSSTSAPLAWARARPVGWAGA